MLFTSCASLVFTQTNYKFHFLKTITVQDPDRSRGLCRFPDIDGKPECIFLLFSQFLKRFGALNFWFFSKSIFQQGLEEMLAEINQKEQVFKYFRKIYATRA